MKFEVPSNLKVKRYIHDTEAQDVDILTDKVHYVCHAINKQMQLLDEDMCYKGVNYPYGVPLHSKLLEKALGRGYNTIIRWMIDSGIIETDGYYEPGSKSMYYRFTNQYRYANSRWVSPKTKRFKELNTELDKSDVNQSPTRNKRLLQRLGNMYSNITINVISANEWVDKYYNQQKAIILCLRKCVRQKKLKDLSLKCNSYRESIKRFNLPTVTFKPDDFGHRLYTPLTSLKKELRQFVRYKGEYLVEIDLANSQLFLLIPLLNWKLYHPQAGNGKKGSLKHTIWIGERDRRLYNNTIMFCKTLEVQYSKGFQEISFVSDACKGIIYEKVGEYLSAEGYFEKGESDEQKRAHVKKYLLKLIFASPIEHHSMYGARIGAIWEAFKACYPEVGQVVSLVKEVDYKAISRLLQRIESYCMIDGLCKAVNDKHPEIPLFTLHDCIVTTKGYVEMVEKELLSVVTGIVGFTPTVKKKAWYNTANSFIVLISRIGNIINAIRKRAA